MTHATTATTMTHLTDPGHKPIDTVRISLHTPQKATVEVFKFSDENPENSFKRVSIDEIESNPKKLKSDMIIVFKDGKMARLKAITSKTSIKHEGSYSYSSPHTGVTEIVSVLAGSIVNGGEGPIRDLSHFLTRK